MVIILTMQSKLGAKINILADRLCDYISGDNNQPVDNKQSGVKRTQPLANKQPIIHQPSQADYLDHSQILPSNPLLTAMPQQQQQQQQPAGQPIMNEPMAANDSMGGFASW